MYRIDLTTPTVLVPCTFEPSINAPGKTLCVNEDGSALVVEPDGVTVRTVPADDPNFDSPWTQAEATVDGFLVYRSVMDGVPGVPRGYKMVGG